ncbi:sulfotransferase [uncultured Desulfobacter sp.]|uniref:sulfotransferase family protein n=1 Tax=uncultured Desulfobacter sp. TaxID=240139 RepID=UPI0029F4DD72|nr:sulfotransferase [uncultured Desulfobacter sp.]
MSATNIKKVMTIRARLYLRLFKLRVQLLKARVKRSNQGGLPDVLCVGVPKAATTWLYFNLNSHPEVILPPKKELHFFSHRYNVKSSNSVFNHKKKNSYWNFQFELTNPVHWRWYKSQFRGGENKVKIDITPTYCRVSKERIRQIKQRLPLTKIILIIRNPIDRAWSGASYFMDQIKGKSMAGLDLKKEILPWVLDAERLDYGNYIDMINTWDAFYDEEMIKYVFYDDINSDPEGTLNDIAAFIGISKMKGKNKKDPNKRINSDYKKIKMPLAVELKLREIYFPQIAFLENRFKRDLSSWQE